MIFDLRAWRLTAYAVVLVLLFVAFVTAQDGIPSDIVTRTKMISVTDGRIFGTAFAINLDDKFYLITAKHVVPGVPSAHAHVQILSKDKWVDLPTLNTIYPKSGKVDIVAFDLGEKAPQKFSTLTISEIDGNIAFGQTVWFVGYPFGLSSHSADKQFAFVKRASLSAIDATDMDAAIYYFDGFNNPGFSGGPVVYWDFQKHVYAIVAVVEGFKSDTAELMVNGQQESTNILTNSGIMVAYGVSDIVKAIRESEKQ